MSEFGVGEEPTGTDARRLMPMQVGSAVVYVEAVGTEPVVEAPGDLELVGAADPTEAFEKASDALRECVRIIGERLDRMGEAVKPKEVGVEFTITFDVEGQVHIIPVLLTGRSKAAMGVKVTAKWNPGA